MVALASAMAVFVLALPAGVQAAPGDPISEFTPQAPPGGSLSGPCGLAVDSSGRFYVADHDHGDVNIYTSTREYLTSAADSDPLRGPCGLAVSSTGALYMNSFHGGVRRYAPSSFPVIVGTTYGAGVQIDAGPATGVAVDPATNDVYVDNRTHVSVYDSSGNPVEEGGEPLEVGAGTLGDGYGVAVSSFAGEGGLPATEGYVYVPDASTDTVKVYNPATSSTSPVQTLTGPPGGFVSLRDSSVAVDREGGDVYVLDGVGLDNTERPVGVVDAFDATGAYQGHLKYEVVDGMPSGLAIDNSVTATQGRVYVSSGITDRSGLYIYTPAAAVLTAPLGAGIPSPSSGGGSLFPTIPIGGAAAAGSGIACEGDACQALPPQPVDPTLTTLISGPGNPAVRYQRGTGGCRHSRHVAHKSHSRSRRLSRRAKGCARSKKRGAGRVSASRSSGAFAPASLGAATQSGSSRQGSVAAKPGSAGLLHAVPAGLLAGSSGFGAFVSADGAAATQAGSHPYQAEFNVGLDQGKGAAELREVRIAMPAGLLANPAATGICTAAKFATPRSSPFESSESGESCPDRTQVGTIEVETSLGGGETRRFGLFELNPPEGSAIRFGASPYGMPLAFDGQVRASGEDPFGLTIQSTEIPQGLHAHGLRLTLWGTPWDASHNVERGNCLDELESAFAREKCSVGADSPLAALTLPTRCGEPLNFTAQVASWQGSQETVAATSGGPSALLEECGSLGFSTHPEGVLNADKASTGSGFVFRLTNEDPGLANPRSRIHSLAKLAVVRLPRDVTLNASLGAGLEGCTPSQLGQETAFNSLGAGCPNSSKIGSFRVRSPFYQGLLEGSIHLAKPRDNPFGSLLAVYLVAKSADRGMLFRIPGELIPDAGDGTITAIFDDLPQLPYTDLEVNFRSGQRAPLVSPPRCGPATTRMEIAPWSGGTAGVTTADTEIHSGIGGGPCPAGTPPFAPSVLAGGVNSNVNSYTPYFIHIARQDTEQEITSYSLELPEGITGKLAGIPYCPDAAIEAARHKSGIEEEENPSCPVASEVGHVSTGYGVGASLTYTSGHIYLAGPYNGRPLSLVVINPATVGPFDVGVVVIRSAFSVNEHTAQLQIDRSASDRIPHILSGIPLHLRDIRIYMDRYEFTHNPSSCASGNLISNISGAGLDFISGADDSTATSRRYFQLLNCRTLGFKPSLGIRLRGPTRRGAYPELRATFAARGQGDTNLKEIKVSLPHSEFLAQNHVKGICTRAQFAMDACPANTVYGKAIAYTPLFDEPLRGNVYLRSSHSKLPDMVASIHSGAIRIVLEGKIGPTKQGGISAFFTGLPDQPVDRFVMVLNGGRRGLLQNSSDICKLPPEATVQALGQTNLGRRFTTVLSGQCKKKERRPRKHRRPLTAPAGS